MTASPAAGCTEVVQAVQARSPDIRSGEAQLSQKTSPQLRQWCLRVKVPNTAVQPTQDFRSPSVRTHIPR